MKKASIFLMILVLCVIPVQLSALNTVNVDEYTITISEVNNVYQVKERVSVDAEMLSNSSIYYFQLPSTASTQEEVTFAVENTQIPTPSVSNKRYEIPINTTQITDDMVTIDITYYLPLSTDYFQKTFLHNSSIVTVKFKDTLIFEDDMQPKNSTLQLKLIGPVQPGSFGLYTSILIALLVIIIIVTSYYAFVKRKNGKVRKRSYESTEVLETEKNLLLNTLKDIEKMHRNQKISDDSYHKLKSFYKQQTVDIMSALEEYNK